MLWNYRIVENAEGWELAEVYYDDDGKPEHYGKPFLIAEKPDETPLDLINDIKAALRDVENYPVLKAEDIGK